MKKLYLLDGMALAYRAHFALIRSPIYTSKGFNTSAIFGFTSTLIELIAKQKPSHLAVVFDTSAPTQRHILHPDYKANREAMPEDLKAAMPHLDRITSAFGIPVLKLDGYEADDIIGTLAHRAQTEGFDQIFMVTPDKDFGQLVTDKIKMYRPGRKGDGGEILGEQEIKDKWGIARVDQVIDMLGLCGDTADNIPGIPGIGPKSAEKLLAKYDTVEGLLSNISELKGKQQEKVRDHADMARLSKKLATIQLDVPIDINWEEVALVKPSSDTLVPLFNEFEFRTLAKRIFGSEFSVTKATNDLIFQSQEEDIRNDKSQLELIPDLKYKKLEDIKTNYRIINDSKSLNELVANLTKAGQFAFDTETTSLNPRVAKLVGISFSSQASNGWWVPVSDAALVALRPIFSNPNLVKIGHNLKFDLAVLAVNKCPVMGPCYDTMIAHALIDPNQRHGLDTLAEDHLKYTTIRFNELLPNAKKDEPIDYSEVSPQALANYAIEDADITWQLWQKFAPKLKSSGQANVFYEIETPLLPVLVEMENEGIEICELTLKNIGASFENQITHLQEAVFREAGQEFNLNSPKQLGTILFDELQLVDKPKKTKTGQYATNEQVLSTLSKQHTIVANLLEYRQLTKLKSTYIDALPKAVDPVSGRVHTHYGQVQTATGRLTSNDPNLQNIPVRSTHGRNIRKAFIARKGWKLLAADYSQIELRILAALTKDDGLLSAFRKGQDIHTATAAKIFECPPQQITRDQRSTAKMVNFGIPYGISAFGLSQRLGTVSRSEAQDIIDSYFAQFPGIAGYMDAQQASAREHGYVETICGRRRYLRDIHSNNGTIRAAAERNAINMPIQGTAADMIKIAMVRIQNTITKKELSSRMLLQVHDELIFDMDPSEEAILRTIITKGMQGALEALECPIEIDIGIGDNWLQAH